MQEFYVDNEATLLELCERLKHCERIAFDTEFIREKTYYAQFCLLQLATDDLVACVDPLALDLTPLLEVLYSPDILKVMHAGRQDMEIFFDLCGKLPQPIFDTQIAASVLGYGNQVGYANLVQEVLGVSLEKAHSRTDWSRRPLDDAQREYALDDVRYLFAVHDSLDEALTQKGRGDWLRATSKRFTALKK